MKIKYILLVLCLNLLMGCSDKGNALPGLDLKEWRADKNGCTGYRSSQLTLIEKNKNNLFGFSEKEVLAVLGPPDQTELIDRSEKYFSYFLNGNSNCPEFVGSTRINLRLRFNSLGYSKEVLVLAEKI